MSQGAAIRYSILDPTGNITALVEHAVDVDQQPAVAARIMERHPEVEQVGFVRPEPLGSDVQVRMRMAGGEFCGNATMSAAALFLLRSQGGLAASDAADSTDAPQTIWVVASGAEDPVEVRLRRTDDTAFSAEVHMPSARAVRRVELSHAGTSAVVPLVEMEGISHVVIEPTSPFARLRGARDDAEDAVRAWCAELRFDGLGLMFLEGLQPHLFVTPLVFVPGSNTTFWENSCASGSAAVGSYLATSAGAPVDVALAEPGGTLRVKSDPASGATWLSGSVRMVTTGILE